MDNAFTFGLNLEQPADSEKNQIGFYWTKHKFEDMMHMAFSLPEQDDRIITYPSDTQPSRSPRTIHCPIRGVGKRAPNWQTISPEVREAIRRGFRRGVGRLFKLERLDVPENWALHNTVLGEKAKVFLDMVEEKTAKTRHYGAALKNLNYIINTAFESFEYVPYHPEFDRAFKLALADMPLNEISNYVKGTCLSNSLNTVAGVDYLLDLAIEVAEIHWPNQGTQLERVRTCLTQVQTKETALLLAVTPALLVGSEKSVEPITLIEPKPTIASLCIHPICESDVISLLLHLGVIAEVEVAEGAKTTHHVVSQMLKGKSRGIISAFPAAFGVLSQAKLFSGDKKKWSAATASTYGQHLGRKVLEYEKSLSKDNKRDSLNDKKQGSIAFDKYTRKAEDWLFDWQERLEQTPNRRY